MVCRLGVFKGVLCGGFCKCVFLGYFDDGFMGWVNGCEIRLSDEFSLGTFLMDPRWVILKDMWS